MVLTMPKVTTDISAWPWQPRTEPDLKKARAMAMHMILSGKLSADEMLAVQTLSASSETREALLETEEAILHLRAFLYDYDPNENPPDEDNLLNHEVVLEAIRRAREKRNEERS
jgi:hypothetical protein